MRISFCLQSAAALKTLRPFHLTITRIALRGVEGVATPEKERKLLEAFLPHHALENPLGGSTDGGDLG